MDYTKGVQKSLQLFMKHEHQINQLTNCHNDINSRERLEQMFSQLMTALSQNYLNS